LVAWVHGFALAAALPFAAPPVGAKTPTLIIDTTLSMKESSGWKVRLPAELFIALTRGSPAKVGRLPTLEEAFSPTGQLTTCGSAPSGYRNPDQISQAPGSRSCELWRRLDLSARRDAVASYTSEILPSTSVEKVWREGSEIPSMLTERPRVTLLKVGLADITMDGWFADGGRTLIIGDGHSDEWWDHDAEGELALRRATYLRVSAAKSVPARTVVDVVGPEVVRADLEHSAKVEARPPRESQGL
jgi:hypothetical protein